MNKKGNKPKISIIGGGISGLAAAALLARKGYTVTILEKNDQLGGRAMHFKAKGFTFDMGPSWYLMPDVFEKYFKIFKRKPQDYYILKKLNPQSRIFFSKKNIIDISISKKENLETFEKLEKGAGKKVSEYIDLAKKKYDIAINEFVYKNYDSIFDFFNKRMLVEGTKLDVFSGLDSYLQKFTKNEKIRQILGYSTVFLGASPYNAPALFSIMGHVDFNQGVYYIHGGINKLVEALEKLAIEKGVKIIKNSEVKEILISDEKVYAIKTTKKTFKTDILISTADYAHTEIDLLEKEYQTYNKKYWNKKTLAPSAFVAYIGIKGKVKKLKHHNLFFSNNWENHFKQIFDNPSWPKKPSYYVCCPSKTDSTVAPKNTENIFILVPVAPGLKDSDKMRNNFFNMIIDDLEKQTSESLKKRIVYRKIVSQRDYIKLYNSFKGSALGLAHTLFQSAYFRPSNKSKKVQNLFYAGQYTQPGIGMPMCLISAELVEKRVESYLNEQTV